VGRAVKPANEQLAALLDEAGVSRKGLARRVADLGLARGLPGLTYDHSSVARWLAGQQPREPVPELIAEVLGALLLRRVTVAELGMTPSIIGTDIGLRLSDQWTECVTTATVLWRADVERLRFLQDSALAASAASAAALQWLVGPSAAPPSGEGWRQVGAADVASLRQTAQTFRELDNRLGGGRVRGAVMQYLTIEVTPILAHGQFSADTGRQLAGAAAELAQLAGWMAYDTGLHGHAQRYLTLALSFARHAADDGLGAEILAAQAQQAVYLGRPAEAVDLARAAQATARRAGLPTLLAECCVMEAHGHAAANDARSCARALSAAESAFDGSQRRNDPGWLRYFDEAYLAARMAHCFRDLGEPRHAERYARRSLDMDGRFVRGKVFNLALLATALAEQGDIEQACVIGGRAVDLAAGIRSDRSLRYVRDLQRALRPAAGTPAVRELTARVAQRLPAASAHAGPR
jgi:tetratricopeptide (TPR) repeat protein